MNPSTAALAVCLLFSCSSPSTTSVEPASLSQAAPAPVALVGPASALQALTRVLDVLEATQVEGVEIVVREYSADSVRSRSENPPAVDVKLELSFFHADSLVATRAYGQLLKNLEDREWCGEVARGDTRVLDGGAGIYVELKTRVLGSPRSVSGDLDAQRDQPELVIRSAAAQPQVGIGQVDISFSRTEPAPGVEDLRFRIKPAERQSRYLLQAIKNLCIVLDQDERMVVTEIEIDPFEKLRPNEKPSGRWTFEITTTMRQAAP